MPRRTTGQASGRRKPSPTRVRAQHTVDRASIQPEPNSDNVDLTSIVTSMIKSTKKRRDIKRTALKREHNNRMTETRRVINDGFSERERKTTQLRKAQLARLCALLKRKDEIEIRMAASVRILERAYLARSMELRAALDSRIAELR